MAEMTIDQAVQHVEALLKAGRYAEAVDASSDFSRQAPKVAPFHFFTGLANEALGRIGEAAAGFLRALALVPGDPHLNLRALAALGHLGGREFGAAFAEWCRITAPDKLPSDALAKVSNLFTLNNMGYDAHLCASTVSVRAGIDESAAIAIFGGCLTGEEAEDRQPTCDGMLYSGDAAASFNSHDVHHNAALHFASAVRQSLPRPSGLSVLDVACGTGLVGSHLTSHASRLVGIEWSEEMAAQARALGCFDDVIVGEMVETMGRLPASCDIITCLGATYFLKDLSGFLRAAATALKPDGGLFFSDFPAPEGRGVMLTRDGNKRWCRSIGEVTRLAMECGFKSVEHTLTLYSVLPVVYWRMIR